ncbi:MAG: hypothetical protein EPN85_12715, partial [Bacteroidetes bacterium]
MKNKSTSAQFTAIHSKMGSILWLILFFLPLCDAFSQNTWVQKTMFPAKGRYSTVGFSIGAKGYVGTGWTGTRMQDFWEWDQATDTWTQKADFGGGKRSGAVGFSVGSKGYIGTGFDNGYKQDFWEYDQATNLWTKKADFGGIGRSEAVGFSIGTRGYIGTGENTNSNQFFNDFWEWNQSTDVWTQKANYGGKSTYSGVGFSIGNKGYTGTGRKGAMGTLSRDFWEWDQANDVWTQKSDFGGTAREGAIGFSIGNKGYIGTGTDGSSVSGWGTQDIWEWNQATNIWTQKADFPGGYRHDAVAFSIGNNGYISTGLGYWSPTGGHNKNKSLSDLWEYTPDSTACAVTASISSDPSSTVCVGQNVFISASGGTTYSWNTGAAGANIVVAPSITTTYSVTVTDAAGCTGIGTLTVPVDSNCTATGISQFTEDVMQVNIWPNPSIGEFRIGDLGLGIYNLDLYNVFGEKVYADKILNPE